MGFSVCFVIGQIDYFSFATQWKTFGIGVLRIFCTLARVKLDGNHFLYQPSQENFNLKIYKTH